MNFCSSNGLNLKWRDGLFCGSSQVRTPCISLPFQGKERKGNYCSQLHLTFDISPVAVLDRLGLKGKESVRIVNPWVLIAIFLSSVVVVGKPSALQLISEIFADVWGRRRWVVFWMFPLPPFPFRLPPFPLHCNIKRVRTGFATQLYSRFWDSPYPSYVPNPNAKRYDGSFFEYLGQILI